jgi:hypothetical protein
VRFYFDALRVFRRFKGAVLALFTENPRRLTFSETGATYFYLLE